MGDMFKLIDSLITKRNILILSLWAVFLFVLAFIQEGESLREMICESKSVGCEMVNAFAYKLISILVYTMLFVFLLPFSLITYFQHDRIFKAWARFAVSWIGLFIVLLSLANGSTGSGWVGGGGGGILVLAFFLAVYVIVSILIILVQSVRVNGL